MPRFPRHPFAARRAKELRKNLTDEEALLWYHIRSDVPAKFRRQEPIGRYICDFVSYHPRLVVELDGGDHDADYDRVRDAWLRSQGFRVLRFSNYEMKYETEAVLEAIYLASSSPSGGGGAR
jgi:very-short-patch-repair endonuclease